VENSRKREVKLAGNQSRLSREAAHNFLNGFALKMGALVQNVRSTVGILHEAKMTKVVDFLRAEGSS
jgi:hypothetical protein